MIPDDWRSFGAFGAICIAIGVLYAALSEDSLLFGVLAGVLLFGLMMGLGFLASWMGGKR